MPRNIDPTMLSALLGDCLLAFFCDIQTLDTTVHLWSGPGQYVWNGHTYTGTLGPNGQLAQLVAASETVAVSAQGLSLILSGIPSDIVSEASGEIVQGLPASLYLAVINPDATIAGMPLLTFAGAVDSVEQTEDGATSTIKVNVESELIDLQRARDRRYTDGDQKFQYPTDEGFSFVAALQQEQIGWGGTIVAAPPQVWSPPGNRGPIGGTLPGG